MSVSQADERDDKDDDKKTIEKSIEVRVEVDDEGNVKVKGTEDGKKMDLSNLSDMLKVHLGHGEGKGNVEARVEVIAEALGDGKMPALVEILGDGIRGDGKPGDGGKAGKHKVFIRRLVDGDEGDGDEVNEFVHALGDDMPGALLEILGDGDKAGKHKVIIRRKGDGDHDQDNFEWIGDIEGAPNAALIKRLMNQAGNQKINIGKAGRYRLGVALEPVSDALRAHLGIDEDTGLMVGQVLDDTPAEEIGLKRFDILVGIGDDDISAGSQASLVKAIEAAGDAGEKISISYVREGKRQRKRFKPQKAETSNEGDDDDDEDENSWTHEGDDDGDGEDDDDEEDEDLAEINTMLEREARRARSAAARARGQADRARVEAADARKIRKRVRMAESSESVDDLKKEVQELREAIEEIREALRENDN